MQTDGSTPFEQLSPEQLDTLQQVRAYVKDHNLLDEQRATDWNLLRFCRARNFSAAKAIEMIEQFCRWFYPAFADVGALDPPGFAKLRAVYGHGFHRTDREGRPVYIEKVSELKVNEIFANYTDEDLTRYYVQSYERMVHVIFPECSRAANRRIDQCVNIIDLSGVNVLSLFVGKTKQFLSFAVEIAQRYYPELMHKTFIVNTGYLFSGAWMVIKGWLDPKTQAKMQICSGSGRVELLRDIDPECLPRFLGGTCDDDIRLDPGPWSAELQRAQADRTLFHSDPGLVRAWYPPLPAPAAPTAGEGGDEGEDAAAQLN